MEKLRNGGMVIMNGRGTNRSETTFTTHEPPLGALEGPNHQVGDNRESIDGGRSGQSMKRDGKISRGGDHLLSDTTRVSIGVQTDPVADSVATPTHTPRRSIFSIGGPNRKDSVISCTDSGIENGNLDVDTRSGDQIQNAEPRPMAECLTIYKSDVSHIWCAKVHVHACGHVYMYMYLYLHVIISTCTCKCM